MNSRLEHIDLENASEKQKEIIARLDEGRGRIPTPFNIWLHNPGLAEGMEMIGTRINRSQVLSNEESEVVVLSTAVFWDAPYVITNHHRKALKAGVPEAVVSAILERRRPQPTDSRLAAICDAVFDILAGGKIEDTRFSYYQSILGREVIAELFIVVGYFTSVSLAMSFHALQPKG